MKLKVLQHSAAEHLPSRKGDPMPTSRNLDSNAHPFSTARERTRALGAAKMARMFSEPFVGSLGGHVDAVEVIARKPHNLSVVASASWDGEIIVHDIPQRKHLVQLPSAHKGKVTGMCWSDGDKLLSCGVDRTVKLWDTRTLSDADGEMEVDAGPSEGRQPLNIFPAKFAFNSIDHHRTDPIFATASSIVQIWDETKNTPISDLTHSTSSETVSAIRFNLSESSILASIGSDRTFTLYDIRTGKAERRVVTQFRSNALSWSPTFPTTILLASEDHNLYTFDIRSLDTPTQIYKSHVAAVVSCDWSPTGTEFVSGSWDRTIRIWKEGKGHTPVMYHTKRMQRVTSTMYTNDARFVLTGSDDGNVRIWKARASEKLGIVTAREKAGMEYRDSLVEKWKDDEEIKRVLRSHRGPKSISKASQLKHTMLSAERVKEERRRKHTRAGDKKPKAEKKKIVLDEQS